MSTAPPTLHDVVVVGAGVVGSAVARELAGFDLRVALLDARPDVGDGTSKANTAILHTGFDATPGTLESRLVREGYDLLGAYAEATGIPVERTGAVLVAWDDEQRDALPGLQRKAEANGYDRTELIGADEVYKMLPHLGEGALAGLTVPDESIICTWTTTLALATEAVQRGVVLMLDTLVRDVDVTGPTTTLLTSRGPVTTRWVVNAAGLGSDVLDRRFGHDRFTVTPRRGELLVYDKQARPLVDRIVLPVPTALGKGVLVSPTIYGNVMLGPTAQDLQDRTDTGTSEEGFAFLLEKGRRLMPTLLEEEVTASYAGLRAASDHSDYVVEADAAQRYVLAGGIRSTGLTAGMAIARHLVALIRDTGTLPLTPRTDLPAPPRMPNLGEAFLRPYQDAARIAADPAYGKVVCFCERVTAGEIRDALYSTVPAGDLEGLRRRTRAQNGRCQGFFCGAEVGELLEEGGTTTTPAVSPTVLTPTVAIVGAGPSGLRAAAELAARLDGEVLVLERESEAGGIPRHSDHPGYGIRDLGRFVSGPKYARLLREKAVKAGARILTNSMVTGWAGERSLEVTSPQGRFVVEAQVVVLATGARERPRPARLIPGDRGHGVVTTGQLQNLVHLKHGTVGKRAVVVGAELVSWSAAMTLKHAGCRTVLITTQYPRPDAYALFHRPGRLLFRTEVATRTRVVRILGRPDVTGVELEDLDTGERRVVECDTVVLTGDWIPDNELARAAGLEMDPGSRSPRVDGALRTSRPGVFAVGNVLHPVDTADVAALDGAAVADQVVAHLAGRRPPAEGLELGVEAPFRWVTPQVLRAGDPEPPRRRLLLWSDEFVARPVVVARQGGRVVARRRLPWPAAPGRVFRVPSGLLRGVDPAAGPVTLGLSRTRS